MNKKQLIVFWVVVMALSIICSVFAEPTKVLFSPNGGCQEAIISEISKAEKTIDIAMYYLTSREIAQELVKVKEKGVVIRVFLDQSQEHAKYAKSRYLAKRGIEIRFYVGDGLMHNKFAVIDDKALITGSFNWTATAQEKNQENLLIIKNSNLIKDYSKRFKILWGKGRKSKILDKGKLEE